MNRGQQTALVVLVLLLVMGAVLALLVPLVVDMEKFGLLTGAAPAGAATVVPAGQASTTTLISATQPAGDTLLPTARVIAGPLNLRDAPGTLSNVLRRAEAGERYQVTRRSADDTWVELCCYNTQRVWAAMQYLEINGALDTVPVVP